VLRNIVLIGIIALVAAVPAQANQGKELRITGEVVRVSGQAVSVENAVGDAILTCVVPERLAEKAALLKVGDRVRMLCVRFKGRKATLVRFERPGAKKPVVEKPAVEKPVREKQEAAGPIVEIAPAGIVVQGAGARVACRVPAEKSTKLAGLKVGDKVKIYCLDGQLAGLERYEASEKPKPAGEELKLYGKIAELSRASVTVRGEAGSLTCSAPEGFAEKILARFAVGDSVKMMCRGSELTYLEKV
jgi:ribosomal protein S1